jgi:hypothetical protein
MRWEKVSVKPLTYLAAREIDFNRDGRFGKEEMLLGFASGKVSFANPAMKRVSRWFKRSRRIPKRLVRADSRRSAL